MTDFSDIYHTDTGMTLPDGVHVFAREEALGNIAILDSALTLHNTGLDEDFPPAAIEHATIAVVEIDSNNPSSLARLERLRALRPNLPVIAGLQAAPVATVRSLLRKGVSDVLELPFSSEELVAAIIDVARISETPAAPVELAPVIAVIGAAGGVGATTVATQLAPLMPEHLGDNARAALIDLSLQSGDASAYLDKQAKLTIHHIFGAVGRIDDELIRSVAMKCDDGFDLIAAPDEIEPIESAPAEAVSQVLRETRKRYDLVILDMPSTIANWAMPVLLSADVVVLVGLGKLSALRHVKRKLSLLQMLGRPRDSIAIVLNRCESGLFKRADASQMEELLHHPVEQMLEDEPSLLEEAQLQGYAVSHLQKRAKLSKQFAELAAALGGKIEKDS